MRWTTEQRAELEHRWNVLKQTPRVIRREMGITRGQLAGRVTKYTLQSQGVPRFHNPDAPAVWEGRTRFPGQVTSEGAALKPGTFQRKLGKRVTKGKWKGMPIYSLTLEERATCPKDCKLWTACYGNNLHWAKRMSHGPALEAKIWVELRALARRHRRTGFVVRLHILGDFWSVGYVELWAEALDAFPGLRVFGYTAWQPTTRIGRALAALRDLRWDRFAIRTSGATQGPRTLVVKDERGAKLSGAIVCPVETGKTACCGTCSLCWATTKPIVFIEH